MRQIKYADHEREIHTGLVKGYQLPPQVPLANRVLLEIGLLLAEGGEEEKEDVYRDGRKRKSVGEWRFGLETNWKRSKARNIEGGFKLFYHGVDGKRNGVGVILKEECSKSVKEVKRVFDRAMIMKLEVEGVIINVISAYAQVGCEMKEKEKFSSELDEAVEGLPRNERLVIGVDFNGHVGEGNRGDEVMGGYGFKERNVEGQMVVDFAKRMEMAVVNTYFKEKEDHRVYFPLEESVTELMLNSCVV
ncbi:hypothetical protein C0J45_6387 [Silurus meridionalis]|nr:hypothetical protein C0J45_6387 [Silurus meridionalis]